MYITTLPLLLLTLVCRSASSTPIPDDPAGLLPDTVPVPEGAVKGSSIYYCPHNEDRNTGLGTCTAEYPILSHCMKTSDLAGMKGPIFIYGGIECNFFSEPDCSTGGKKKSWAAKDIEWANSEKPIRKWEEKWPYKAYACKSFFANYNVLP